MTTENTSGQASTETRAELQKKAIAANKLLRGAARDEEDAVRRCLLVDITPERTDDPRGRVKRLVASPQWQRPLQELPEQIRQFGRVVDRIKRLRASYANTSRLHQYIIHVVDPESIPTPPWLPDDREDEVSAIARRLFVMDGQRLLKVFLTWTLHDDIEILPSADRQTDALWERIADHSWADQAADAQRRLAEIKDALATCIRADAIGIEDQYAKLCSGDQLTIPAWWAAALFFGLRGSGATPIADDPGCVRVPASREELMAIWARGAYFAPSTIPSNGTPLSPANTADHKNRVFGPGSGQTLKIGGHRNNH